MATLDKALEVSSHLSIEDVRNTWLARYGYDWVNPHENPNEDIFLKSVFWRLWTEKELEQEHSTGTLRLKKPQDNADR